MSARLFKDHHFRTPGYFRRQGSIYLVRLPDGRQQLMANSHGPAPYGALWSAQGVMSKLRVMAERIIEANSKLASESGDHVVFSGAPQMPPQTPRGLSHRPRVGPPSDVWFGRKADANTAQPVEIEEKQDDTEEQIRPQAPSRKKRKRRTVTAPQAEPLGEAVEDPAVDKTLPETSTHGDETV